MIVIIGRISKKLSWTLVCPISNELPEPHLYLLLHGYRATQQVTGSRGFAVSRSTFPGTGRYAGHWLGDNFSGWEDLKYSIIGVYTHLHKEMISSGPNLISFANAKLLFYDFPCAFSARWSQQIHQSLVCSLRVQILDTPMNMDDHACVISCMRHYLFLQEAWSSIYLEYHS